MDAEEHEKEQRADDGADDGAENGEDAAAASEEGGLIDEDMPCIRCHYNLRGLHEEGRCPECGTAIEKTVAYVMQRIMCGTCMAPNHPSMAMCTSCGSPLTGAAANANYFRTTAIAEGRRKKRSEEEEEPEAPSAALVGACWTMGLVAIPAMGITLSREWTDASDGVAEQGIWTVALVAGIAAVLAVMYYPVRAYRRQRREYVVKHAAFMEKERAADEAEAAARRARGLSAAPEIEGKET